MATEFTLFLSLPLELQRMIWSHTIDVFPQNSYPYRHCKGDVGTIPEIATRL
jgi:hypothetical protein